MELFYLLFLLPVQTGKLVSQKLCEFITKLCALRFSKQSKDMHSILVAAFHSLGSWLSQFPLVLFDKDIQHRVLEILELGLSGSTSVRLSPTGFFTAITIRMSCN